MMPYLLLFLGLLFIWLEFYLPGTALAIIGTFFVIGAVVSFYAQGHSIIALALFFLIAAVLVGLVVWLAIVRIRKSASKNTFYLSTDQEGFRATPELPSSLIGKRGVTLTEFGPSGYLLIEGKRYPAICRGPYIDKGKQVEVIAQESGHLIVRPVNIKNDNERT